MYMNLGGQCTSLVDRESLMERVQLIADCHYLRLCCVEDDDALPISLVSGLMGTLTTHSPTKFRYEAPALPTSAYGVLQAL